MLYTPNGEPAREMDRIMLLAMWARQLIQEKNEGINSSIPNIIIAGIGKPTFPINETTAKTAINYWKNILEKSEKADKLLTRLKCSSNEDQKKIREDIANLSAAVDYGDPQGDYEARQVAAIALNHWYGNKTSLESHHILFTVGGVGGLYNIFKVINRRTPGGIIVTSFPHYNLYTGAYSKNNLFPIPLMNKSGYRLTADILSESLREAHKKANEQNNKVAAFVLCDPNNPLGTALTKQEHKEIIEVLAQYPDILIVLDEAYAEMRFNGDYSDSLFSEALESNTTVIDRIILMRSATKAFSTAGERMALIATLNKSIMTELIQENIKICGHAPRSSQIIFAEALLKIKQSELENIREYYQPQVNYVMNRLINMNAAMPDDNYQVQGTFYVLADLSELFGLDLPITAQRALNKKGKISTDEEIAYSLLFENGIMIAPLSYFGLSPNKGYLRITCSGGDFELKELMDRIEIKLNEARKIK